jgi:transcriptional regulator GlxA family with amidase domain
MARTVDMHRFEIFASRGFSELELSAVTHTLTCANDVLGEVRFTWRFISESPGFVTGATGMLIRAEPAIDNYGFSDVMVVLGGTKPRADHWLKRARSMQRGRLPVVLLSDAATAYIKSGGVLNGAVTTHWRDASSLHEEGHHPTLTSRLAENNAGIITAAGGHATCELVIGLIAPQLDPLQLGELGSRMLLSAIRKTDAEQPKGISDNEGLFDARVTRALRLMEQTLADPMTMTDLTRAVGMSTRHLERVFGEVFNETPARFYKRLRVKAARSMIEDTLLPLVDVAIATGFSSRHALSIAIRNEFGLTPTKMRARKSIKLVNFDRG